MAANQYTASDLSVLEGLEAVRKRPGMYIGSTDSRGLMHCLWEIIDNSVDEALAGFGKRILLTLHQDGSVEIVDEARGIPVDIETKTGLTGVEVVFTKLHAGGKFGAGSYMATGGLHGVGASVVNALSERLDVEVRRDGKIFAMSFKRGDAGVFNDDHGVGPDAPFKKNVGTNELRVIGTTKKDDTGTRVRYWADRQIFGKDAAFQREELLARLRQTAFLVPGLVLKVSDLRGEEPVTDEYHFDGGVTEFVEFLALDAAVTSVWTIKGSDTFTEQVPVLGQDGNMSTQEVERQCDVEIAMRWGEGYDHVLKSFVNIIATPKGGTHVNGFEQGLLRFLRTQVEKNSRKLKAGNDKLEKEDVLAGLTTVVTVRLAEPQFEGQTKEVLGTSAVRNIVAKVLSDGLKTRFESSKREDKAQSALVLEKVVGEMKSRISARTFKETQRRKNALESSSLPTKLVDCRSSDVKNSELFIVEGDSALGTAKLARNSEFQALLPIRGKILNVQKSSTAEMLNNQECASIIQVVGAGSGRSFDVDQARYGKIIIMSDADVDGAHIRTLLLTLFFRYMRPLVEAGRVYAAVPPLHRVVIINPGSKPNETVYTYSENELNTLLADLNRKGRKYQEPIQRYKGLGEMDAEQLAETTMDRSHRSLRRVNIEDLEESAHIFELLMGNDVTPRKEFIVQSSQVLSRERIDA